MRPGGIIEVPQIWLSLLPPIFNSRIYTDFFAACAAEDKRVTQISQMTQIFPSYPQMRPIRSDDADFFTSPPVPLIGGYFEVGVKGISKNFCIYSVCER